MIELLPLPLRDLLCLTAPPGSRLLGSRRPMSEADWQAVMDAAVQHRLVLPLLSRLPEGDIPAGPRQRLKALAIQRTRRALRQTAELIRLARLFAVADLPVLSLKGPALAMRIHGQMTARDPGDLDLLIHPADLPRADRLLRDSGYNRTAAFPDLVGDRLEILLTAAADLEFVRSGGRGVDLHWRWHRNPSLMRFDAASSWGNAAQVELGGQKVTVPGATDQLVYLASHGARHLWRRLRWLDDLRWLLADPATATVMSAAMARAAELGASRSLACALALVGELDGLPVPSAAADPAAQRLARHCLRTMPLSPRPSHVGGLRTEMTAGWHLAAGWRERFHGLLVHRLLGPSERDGATLPLPRRWRGLYSVVRPVLWTARQVARWR